MERLLSLIEDINWKKIGKVMWNTIIDNWKVISVYLAFVGLLSLLNSLIINIENNNTRINIINNWKDQLPEEHWINEEFGMRNIMDLQFTMFSFLRLNWDYLITTLEEEGEAGEIIAKTLDTQDRIRESKYILRFQDTNKKVKTIKVKEGEQVDLSFYKGKEQLVFDMTEDEFLNIKENNLFNDGKELVITCIDNTEIATIYNGTITGERKGKTKLFVLCDGYYWEYTVKVK